MKKVLSVFLCAVMLMTALAVAAAPASAAPFTKTIYVDTGDWRYDEIYACAYYIDNGDRVYYMDASGVEMTHYAGAIYQAEFPNTYTHVRICDGSGYCLFIDGEIPTDGKNLVTVDQNGDPVWVALPGNKASLANNSTDIRIDGNLDASIAAAVISVDIAWEAMTFTYKEGFKGNWDPKDHLYKNVVPGVWSDNKPAITVTNHSNVAVNAIFAFTSAAFGVTGEFYEASEGETPTYTSLSDRVAYALFSAEGTARSNAPGKTVHFGITGDAIAKDASLGTVTVSISNAERHVGNELALQLELLGGGTVILDRGIRVRSNQGLEVPYDTLLDLNARALNGEASIWIYNPARCVIRNGEITNNGSWYTLGNCGVLELENVRIYGTDFDNYGKASFKDVELALTIVMDGECFGTQPTLELSGEVKLWGYSIENPNGYTVLVREGTYDFDPMAVLSVYSGDKSITLTKGETNDTYTVTENGVATTYLITVDNNSSRTKWTVTAQ